MPLILGTNSIKDTGYDVANSVRFNGGDSAKFNIDHSGAGSRVKWTLSMWVKRSNLGAEEPLFNARPDSNSETFCGFGANDTLVFKQKNDGSTSGQYVTNRVFRDVSAWDNFIFVYDKDNGTAGDRGIIYVNGVRETSFSASSNFSDISTWNSTNTNNIGNSQSAYFDGYMSEIVFVDGQALSATSFGEFDEDSGIWKPIDVSGLTPGTNGFYLDFEDSSNLGNNAFSSGSADWTETNITAIDQSTDTCTNNFATLNPLAQTTTKLTLREGNLDAERPGSTAGWLAIGGTLGVSSGKWYYEYNVTDAGTPNQGCAIGWVNYDLANFQNLSSTDFNILGAIAWYSRGNIFSNGSNAGGGAYPTYEEDILMLAIDIDNGYCYFGKNGTWGNSGDPTSGSSGTGGVQITSTILGTNGTYSPAVAHREDGQGQANFGSPPYTISSGNTDGDGYGNFEYAVPSGYYSLNTKNLAEYG